MTWIVIGRTELQYLGQLMQRTDSLEKTLMLGKSEGRGEGDDRGWDGWMVSPTRWIWIWASSGSWWQTGKPGVFQSMGSQRVRHDWVTELNWTKFKGGTSVLIISLHCRIPEGKSFNITIIQVYAGWHPTPVLLPGKFHGQRSQVGYSPWGSQRVGHDWTTSLYL